MRLFVINLLARILSRDRFVKLVSTLGAVGRNFIDVPYYDIVTQVEDVLLLPMDRTVCYRGAMLHGWVIGSTFHIKLLLAKDNSIGSSRAVVTLVNWLIQEASVNGWKIDPGMMTHYSARLYWHYVRRVK
jgi:hypothetical protein